MKVRTMIVIDEETKRIVQEQLNKSRISLSGFINTLLTEYANTIKGQPETLNKRVEDLTLKEFGKLASYWINKASE